MTKNLNAELYQAIHDKNSHDMAQKLHQAENMTERDSKKNDAIASCNGIVKIQFSFINVDYFCPKSPL
jgi:hypothetical protein